MPSKLFSALRLASAGFYIFPIVSGHKAPPAFEGWQDLATRDALTLHGWWGQNPHYNIGISTGKFGDGEAILAIDVDNKPDKKGLNPGRGDRELLRLEIEGREMPDTFTQYTPSGGRHYLYRVSTPVRQGAHTLGQCLDIRSAGGYLVGEGSSVSLGDYSATHGPLAAAPAWMIEACGAPREKHELANIVLPGIDPVQATDRAIDYLTRYAPLALQGSGGDETTYKVAARCKDLGVLQEEAINLLDNHWNERCEPPWPYDELREKVRHAYKYGLAPVGSAAPEVIFTPAPGVNGTPHPFAKINQEYAFVLAGGGAHILWETTDPFDRYRLEHLSVGAFHQKFAPQKMQLGRTEHQISQLWLESKDRREYDGLVFMPEQQAPERFYNLWRGFAYAPKPHYTPHYAVDLFLEHALVNVCNGHQELFRWLIGYFAHLVQRPFEKPLVALVFKGAKGVGKNALIGRVSALLGGHALVTSNKRYLLGNFNGHLENCLLFTLDEAFWSGDKQAEGVLKDLITGDTHVIEHKGKEPYPVANKTRVVVIGNEDWLVPASYDERRFAVFEVGPGRKQDRQFFETMRLGMESDGGYPVLLRYLLDFPLSQVNAAPDTVALADQKLSSAHSFHQWWRECLEEGRIVGSESTAFPAHTPCDRFRAAYRRYTKERNISGRIPEDRYFGRLLKQCAPLILKYKASKQDDGSQPYMYGLRDLAEHRQEWDLFMGTTTVWP